MFDIGWTEMLVVAVVMILVVGPRDLPGMLRTIGKTVGNLKRMAGDFQRQFSDALKESELDELKNDLSGDIKQATSIPNPLDDINTSANELLGKIDADVDLDDDIIEDVLSDKVARSAVKAKPAGKKVAKKTPRQPSKSKVAAKATTSKKTATRKPATRKTQVAKPRVKKVSAAKPEARKTTTARKKPAGKTA